MKIGLKFDCGSSLEISTLCIIHLPSQCTVNIFKKSTKENQNFGVVIVECNNFLGFIQ